ncbi:MAG: hypothetical protein HC767_02145 [Akkermansiaceae bacterium]|nr:hypothetical protein [Akkermansiaceae bacterium]
MASSIISEKASAPARRTAGLLRDLSVGLKQQMFFWGRDVVSPRGNLLVEQGFEKTRSTGLQGTSCYGMDWQDGRVELHGACAGWYPENGESGFIYIRPLGKCFTWLESQAPIPGQWPEESLAPLGPNELHQACYPFIDWWLHSEQWIEKSLGSAYRADCYRQHKRLPKSKSWLPPITAARWLEQFRKNPMNLERAKRFDV